MRQGNPSRMLAGAFVFLLGCLSAVAAPGEGRPSVDLDGAWSFRMDPGNVGEKERWFASSADFADTIQVPGAWEAQGFGAETEKLRHHFIGKAWYARQVAVPADWTGRRVFLCFGGVHRYGAVWVNDTFLGEHIGYLSPFEFDITPLATPGSSLRIAVRVDSEQRWDIDTLIGCFDIIDYMDTYWGGLWGHVSLEARGAAHLKDLFVETGITPPRCRASASIEGTPPEGTTLQLEILDRSGNVVSQTEGASLVPAVAGQSAAAELELPGAGLWTPDTPTLYVARLSLRQGGALLDTCETRFGFRQITLDGERILLNGERIFLRGYGDDAIYPATMAAPSAEAVYRKKVALAKECGFNHVRHHSHMLPPEYYDVCDELGLLVSAEFPIAYQQFYARAKAPALDLYKSEWVAVIRRLRNHPSILDWCMGNEMYEGVPLAPELYRIAKELDRTRPVVDSDGLPPSGFTEGTRDRDTLDLYFTQFDVFNTPLDIPDLYACPAPRKPVISHETGNYVTFPRLDQIDLFQNNFKPFWLTAAREKVQRMGLLEETPRWAENTERLYTLLHKSNIEGIRKNPNISGYHWWLLQDYWTTSNGIMDTYFRVKPGVDRAQIRQFNNDIVVLQDGIQNNYRGGAPLQATLLLSNFGPSELNGATISCVVSQGTKELAQISQAASPAPAGALTQLARIEAALPEVETPVRLRIRAQLQAGASTFANEWFTWVYPARIAARSTTPPLYVGGNLLPWLEARGAQALPQQKPYPAEAVYVSNELTPGLIDAAMAGATLILYKPLGVLSAARTRFKTAWWLGSPEDNNAGTVVYDHAVTRAMAPDGWCDNSWYKLLEESEGYLLDELPSAPGVIVRGIEVAGVCRNKAMLFEAALGQGCALFCGLNLDARMEDETPCPAAEWLTARLVEYAGTFPNPGPALPEDFLRARAAEAPQFSPPFVEGFARILHNEGEHGKWFTYRKSRDRAEIVRQTAAGHVIEWETGVVPESLPGDSLSFVFAGGLGWVSQPAVGGFALALNGKEVLRFDVCRGHGRWQDSSGRVTLGFAARGMTSEDTAGLFYLGVPREFVTPGQPCRIAVTSAGAGSQRWFALHPYPDVLGAGNAPKPK